jgi:phosphoribosylamine--glycine ligase
VDDAALTTMVMRTVIEPAIAGMAAEGVPYAGILYAGLMLTQAGPRVLEFNARFGDPETQVLLPRWEDDLATVLLAAVERRLAGLPPFRWSGDATCGVVLASAGYPESSAGGAPIQGLRVAGESALVFHAATTMGNLGDAVITTGGRALTVVGRGGTLDDARRRAYAAAREISFTGCWCRSDIAAPPAAEGVADGSDA